jgi:hypothetical protein
VDQLWARNALHEISVYVLHYSNPLRARGFQASAVFFLQPVFQQMHLVSFIHFRIFVQKNPFMPDSAVGPLHRMYFGTVAGVHVASHFDPENGGMICLRNVGSTTRVLEKIKDRNQHQY